MYQLSDACTNLRQKDNEQIGLSTQRLFMLEAFQYIT